MVLTEEQARTKWCPFARVGNEAGCNRNGHAFPFSACCIASDCMAWRWAKGGVVETKIEAIGRRRRESGDGLMDAKAFIEDHSDYRRRQPATEGFCGLAGSARP